MASLAVGLWSTLLALLGVSPIPTAGGGVSVNAALPSRSVPAHSGSWDALFYVKNTGATTKTFALSCSNVASCAMSPTSVTLTAGQQADVDALYTTGDVDPSGSVSVFASAGTSNGSGAMALDIGPSMIQMTGPGPDASATQTVHRTRPVLRADFVLPIGEVTDTNSIKLWWRGVLASSGTLRRNAAMLEWEVPSDQALAPGDTGTFKVQQCLGSGVCTTESRVIQLPADQKPVVDFVGMPFESTGGGFSTGFGPGLAVSGVDVTTGFATPAYVSMGSARSAALVYSTRTSYPRALVTADIRLPWPTSGSYDLQAILFDGATKMDSLKLSSASCATASETIKACRVVLQARYPGTAISGGVSRRWYKVEVTVTSGGTPQTTADSVEVVLVDRRDSPYGSGWWPSAGVRLYAAGSDRVLVGPSGSATIYRGSGDSLYLPPPGSTTNLVKLSGGGWELRTRGTTAKVVFDANGRVTKGIDASGNKDSLAYDGSGRLSSLIDPTGRTIGFYYGSVTLKLDSVVSLPGYGVDSRRTRVSIDTATNQLRYDSLASPSVRPVVANYAYVIPSGGIKGTAQVLDRWGRYAMDSVHVVYDTAASLDRPSQVRLRAPLSSPGDSVRPVLTYKAADLQGWKSFRSLDSIYVEVTDPRGNWTRSRLARYGQATLTWDAIGTLGRSGLDGFGRTIWAEGKTADSSRVWTQYDSLGRAYRSFVVRAVGDTLWLSRLTFDANDRVIKSTDPLGHSDSTAYDGSGRPVYSRAINGAETRIWYLANGQVDSMYTPESYIARHFTYVSSWLNPSRSYVTGDALSNETQFDGQGVANGSLGRIRVRLTNGQSVWRWRTSTVWRDAAGRPDSATTWQTADCTGSCTTPGSFTRVTTHYVTYDSVGQVRQERDSGSSVSAVTYIRDRLGRVLESQRNGAQGDSTVYDLAGNVITTVTRRGSSLQAYYDSRDRDTSTVIPGYGTVKKTYGGPEGQLTRDSVVGYVDSIGGVEPGRKWVYDQRGRLLSDTLWTGAGHPRATTYSYDSHDRLIKSVDARDTSGTRMSYDAALGRLSGVHTPFGDSLKFDWDTAGRPRQADLVPVTGRTLTQAWSFQGGGSLGSMGATVPAASGLSGYDAGTWTSSDDFADANLGVTLLPVWTRQDGDGTTLHTEVDSLRYDGMERLISWKGMTDGALAEWNDFSYDSSGNLVDANETRTYQAGTNRLTFRVATASWYTYSYDVAGNLISLGDTAWAGNALKCNWQYSYDALDRLTAVRVQGATGGQQLLARYAYDVLGNRIARKVYTTVAGCSTAATTDVRYAVQGGQVLFETDAGGSTKLREYVWGLGTDDLVAIRIPGVDTLYAVKDQLGSIRAWVTRAGTWRWGGRYRPYGLQAESRGTYPNVPYQWTGREYDPETGFYFLRARYYDPKVGRFTQEDPIGEAGGANLYAYVDGQPLEARDPSGMLADNSIGSFCSVTSGACLSWDGQFYGGLNSDEWGGMGGSGGAWTLGEAQANATTAWADAYQAHIDAVAAYRIYISGYDAEKAANEGRNDDLGHLYKGSDKINPTAFEAMYNYYSNREGGSGDIGGFAALMIARLESGMVVVNDDWVEAENKARGEVTFGYSVLMSSGQQYTALRSSMMLTSNYWSFALAHESLHAYFPGAGQAVEDRIDREAYRLSGIRRPFH